VACSFATRHEIGHITNTLRLLKLPEKVQTLVRSGKVSAGHARVLIGRSDAEELAQKIVDMDLGFWTEPL